MIVNGIDLELERICISWKLKGNMKKKEIGSINRIKKGWKYKKEVKVPKIEGGGKIRGRAVKPELGFNFDCWFSECKGWSFRGFVVKFFEINLNILELL